MAAHSENFPWLSHYGHYRYFEQKMQQHAKVSSLKSEGTGLYRISRKQGDELRVFICECYAFGIADFIEAVEQLGPIDIVVINSAWCGYSTDAKRHCRDQKVGLFKIGEFMAALHRQDCWAYLTENENELFQKNGWL